MINGTNYKLFVKPLSISTALHVVFGFVLIMLEPKTNVAPQSLNTSPNQIELIVENKLVQVEFASTNEAKSMNVKDGKPAVNLDIEPNQETKNSINTKNLLHKDNKKTNGIISKPLKETALQEPVIKPRSGLPRSAVTEHNRNSQAQAQTQEFRAARKSAGVTKKEMRNRMLSTKRLKLSMNNRPKS